MATNSTTPQFTLSREELLLILNLLQVNYLFGLEPDPLGDGTPEQQTRMLIQAERALRARELARLNEQGRLIVQRALLEGISSCAYPHKTVAVYAVTPNGQTTRLYGHLREKQHIFRADPEPGLHLFSLHADKSAWLDHLLQESACGALTAATTAPLTLKGATLRQAREAGTDTVAIQKALIAGGVHADAVQWLSAALAAAPHLAVFNVILPVANDQLSRQEVSVLHVNGQAWLMNQPLKAEADTYALSPINTAQLKELLISAL